MTSDLPVIGAALAVPELPDFRDWIRDKERDVELQTFHEPAVIAATGRRLPRLPAASSTATPAAWHPRTVLGLHHPFPGPLTCAASSPAGWKWASTSAPPWAPHRCDPFPLFHLGLQQPRRPPGAGTPCSKTSTTTLPPWSPAPLTRRHAGDRKHRGHRPLDRLRLAQSFDSPAVRVSVDTVHAAYAHVSTGAPPVDVFVTRRRDARPRPPPGRGRIYADRHWSLGEGSILWPSVFRALSRIEARPRLISNCATRQAIAASMNFLREKGLGQ